MYCRDGLPRPRTARHHCAARPAAPPARHAMRPWPDNGRYLRAAFAAPPNPAMPMTFRCRTCGPAPAPRHEAGLSSPARAAPEAHRHRQDRRSCGPTGWRNRGRSGEVEMLLGRLHHIAMHGDTGDFASATISSTGWITPVSLFAVITDTRVRGLAASSRLSSISPNAARSTPSESTGMRFASGAAHHRIMFDRAGDDRVEHRQGKVIGLGSATGEDKVGAAAARQHRDFRSCLFDDHPRGAAIAMHRRRVGRRAHRKLHRKNGIRPQRCCGVVVEIN